MTVSRTLARLFGAASLALSLLAAGCEEQPAQKGPKNALDAAEQARIRQGRKLLVQAEDAINEKKFDVARKALRKAEQLSVESLRFEIEETIEKVDKRHAKLWANEVAEDFKNKNCVGALKQLAEPLKANAESEAFLRELSRLVGPDVLTCAQAAADQLVLGLDYVGARKAIAGSDTKTLLGSTAWKKLRAELETTILEGLRAQIAADMKARKWAAAAEKIDAAEKKGDATEKQVAALYQGIRDAVAPEIASTIARSIGKRDARAGLRHVDALAKVARWVITGADIAALQIGAALPEELSKKRETLSTWVEAQRLAMVALSRPEARYAHGKIQVFPANQSSSPSKSEIPHGTKIWVLGVGRGLALVTTTDPSGSRLVDLLDKVAGWAPTKHLVKDNPIDWLLPEDQIKGQRVWGPLRAGHPLWELGVVMSIQGRDLTVQRLADGQNFKMPRSKLRSGRLSPGTRVLTFCVAKEQPAQVVEVPPSGRTAKLKCDGGQEKEEDLASLRSKPEILPVTK